MGPCVVFRELIFSYCSRMLQIDITFDGIERARLFLQIKSSSRFGQPSAPSRERTFERHSRSSPLLLSC